MATFGYGSVIIVLKIVNFLLFLLNRSSDSVKKSKCIFHTIWWISDNNENIVRKMGNPSHPKIRIFDLLEKGSGVLYEKIRQKLKNHKS